MGSRHKAINDFLKITAANGLKEKERGMETKYLLFMSWCNTGNGWISPLKVSGSCVFEVDLVQQRGILTSKMPRIIFPCI